MFNGFVEKNTHLFDKEKGLLLMKQSQISVFTYGSIPSGNLPNPSAIAMILAIMS